MVGQWSKSSDGYARTTIGLHAYAELAAKYGDTLRNASDGSADYDDWAGGSFRQAQELATAGWAEHLPKALSVADNALQFVTREHELPSFTAITDVTGSEVRVAEYLSGVPECMTEWLPATVSRVGRVITICSSVSCSSAVKPESMVKRGMAVVALVSAIERSGHQTELWVDATVRHSERYVRDRVLVKGAGDIFDAESLLYAYAHPTMFRRLGFAVMHSLAEIDPAYARSLTSSGRGSPRPPAQDLPEGTIYLPEVRSANDVPNADQFVLGHLRNLGLITD